MYRQSHILHTWLKNIFMAKIFWNESWFYICCQRSSLLEIQTVKTQLQCSVLTHGRDCQVEATQAMCARTASFKYTKGLLSKCTVFLWTRIADMTSAVHAVSIRSQFFFVWRCAFRFDWLGPSNFMRIVCFDWNGPRSRLTFSVIWQ